MRRCRCGLLYRASKLRNARVSYWHELRLTFYLFLPLVPRYRIGGHGPDAIAIIPGMTTHGDFAEKSKQQHEYFYSCYSLLGFDSGSEPLSALSIEPIVKQEGILHLTCNLYTVL